MSIGLADRGGSIAGRGRDPFQKSTPLWLPNAESKGSVVQCLGSSLVFVLHFSGADIEFGFVLMTSITEGQL